MVSLPNTFIGVVYPLYVFSIYFLKNYIWLSPLYEKPWQYSPLYIGKYKLKRQEICLSVFSFLSLQAIRCFCVSGKGHSPTLKDNHKKWQWWLFTFLDFPPPPTPPTTSLCFSRDKEDWWVVTWFLVDSIESPMKTGVSVASSPKAAQKSDSC